MSRYGEMRNVFAPRAWQVCMSLLEHLRFFVERSTVLTVDDNILNRRSFVFGWVTGLGAVLTATEDIHAKGKMTRIIVRVKGWS